MYDKINIRIKTQDHIFIGKGDTGVPGYVFILDKDKKLLKKIALSKFILKNYKKINELSIFKNIKNINENTLINIRSLLNKKYNNDQNIKQLIDNFILFETNINETAFNFFNQKINSYTNQLKINEFINHNGNFYIPGSSLKGSIRQAFRDLGKDERFNKIKNSEIFSACLSFRDIKINTKDLIAIKIDKKNKKLKVKNLTIKIVLQKQKIYKTQIGIKEPEICKKFLNLKNNKKGLNINNFDIVNFLSFFKQKINNLEIKLGSKIGDLNKNIQINIDN